MKIYIFTQILYCYVYNIQKHGILKYPKFLFCIVYTRKSIYINTVYGQLQSFVLLFAGSLV